MNFGNWDPMDQTQAPPEAMQALMVNSLSAPHLTLTSFRIYSDYLELVQHVESECQAWFNANKMVSSSPQELPIEEPQFLSLGNMCILLAHGPLQLSSLDADGYGWTTCGSFNFWKFQLLGTGNLRRRDAVLYLEVEALQCPMESMLEHSTSQRFMMDCKDLIA
ncbi:hypothetical protein F2Q69_00048510 [Brassica cretica]|uniref:Uncharacterized protein n=1 Tax=Brassica cretica TaxID=69181 RepID=A0A8S9PT23_BRACR|nr:hypothetical protein F2Q69_00048510 [Brassica cretica]